MFKVLIIGAGGHAKVVIDVVRAAGFDPVAALDPVAFGECNGVLVAGTDDQAASFFAKGVRAAVIGIGDNRLRVELCQQLLSLGFDLPTLVHPSAIVSASARLDRGTIVMPLAVINAAAQIGQFVIINTAAVVEHDCVVGDGAHIAPGTRLGGCVTVGAQALVGIGSTARPLARIGSRALIGAGSTVVGNIADDQFAFGSPARAQLRS